MRKRRGSWFPGMARWAARKSSGQCATTSSILADECNHAKTRETMLKRPVRRSVLRFEANIRAEPAGMGRLRNPLFRRDGRGTKLSGDELGSRADCASLSKRHLPSGRTDPVCDRPNEANVEPLLGGESNSARTRAPTRLRHRARSHCFFPGFRRPAETWPPLSQGG